nr:MAG TPA: hypothetical protein [Caudoviricetes sp.]
MAACRILGMRPRGIPQSDPPGEQSPVEGRTFRSNAANADSG